MPYLSLISVNRDFAAQLDGDRSFIAPDPYQGLRGANLRTGADTCPVGRRSGIVASRTVTLSEASTEAATKDLKADWQKWSGMERISAALDALLMSGMVPVLPRQDRAARNAARRLNGIYAGSAATLSGWRAREGSGDSRMISAWTTKPQAARTRQASAP